MFQKEIRGVTMNIISVITTVTFLFFSTSGVGGADGRRQTSNTRSPIQQSPLKLTVGDVTESYKFGDNISLRVTIENQSDQQAGIEISDPDYQYRPKLFRNGALLEYQPKIAQLVRSKDTDPHPMRVVVVSIDPYSSHTLPRLELNDWYGSLEPGSYRLTNRFRTSYEGPWTKESAEIQFRIEPKN
jgi:hypothetical protein